MLFVQEYVLRENIKNKIFCMGHEQKKKHYSGIAHFIPMNLDENVYANTVLAD